MDVNNHILDKVKELFLKKSNGDNSLYQSIGKLISEELSLVNFHISIINSTNNESEIKYESDRNSIIEEPKIKQRLLEFESDILTHPHPKLFYSEDEINSIFKSEGKKLPSYQVLPIYSKQLIVGALGIFFTNELKLTENVKLILLEINEYLSIYYDQQKSEGLLLQQTSRLNAIFESSSDLIWSVDRSMEVVSFNQNYFRTIFYKYQGGVVSEYDKSGGKVSLPFDEFWEIKYQKVFEGNSLHFEIKLKHPNNSPVWKEVFLIPIFKADGNIDEVSGIARDISDKKETVYVLHKEEEKFKQIFDSFQDLYVKVNLSGEIIMISPSVKKLMGYSSTEILGKDVTDYYLYNVRTKGFLKKVLNSKTLKNIEIKLIGKHGQIVPCICNVRVIYDNKEQPIAIESICRDITEITETNEKLVLAKQSLEMSIKAKEQFLANMSHEIRTPMNGIIGLLEMVLDTKLTNQQNKYLSTIKESSKLLLSLLNDILDLSKMNAEKLKVEKIPLSIKKLVTNTKRLFASELQKKKLIFEIVIADNVPEYVKSDRMRLLQILSNLISNAIKFTPESGSITVNISYQTNLMKVNVIDSGIGIQPKNIKSLFNNFTQINDSYSKQYSGAGLGLVISKKLVKLLNGKIGVNSTYEKGSDFWFTFKSKPTRNKQRGNVDNNSKDHQALLAKDIRSILIVDDNQTNRLVASEILKSFGLLTDEAADAKKAISAARNHSYDIILMDIQMPEIDGIEAMKIIKKNNPKQVIIAMTAYDEPNVFNKFIEMGFDDYLAKPITPTSLINTVNKSKVIVKATISEIPVSYNYVTILNISQFTDIDTITDMCRQFINEINNTITCCNSLLKKHAYTAIGNHMHKIKGDAGTLGFENLAFKASAIEKNIDKEYFTSLDEDLNTLYLISVQIPNFVKEILNRLEHEHKNIDRR